MVNDELLCPVCGKRRFAQRSDNDICKYCGWENDEYYEAGGANTLSLADFRKRYHKYVELNADYIWIKDGYPEISIEDEYQLAHKYSEANEKVIRESDCCGCFSCIKVFKASEITDWLGGKAGKTALCPYCGVAAVLPDSEVELNRAFLEGMHKKWFG